MARKRANSEGTCYKIPNGHWCSQLTLEGHRISKVFDTQKEGLDWIRKMRGRIDDGMTVTSRKIILTDFLTYWLASTKTTKALRTWQHYEQLIRSYMIPSLGMLKVNEINTSQIQSFYNKLYDDHVGVPTIRKLHLLLHASFQDALRSGAISRNPVNNAKPPKEPAVEMVVLDENMARQFLVTAQAHRWYALFVVALSTGCRMNEILGLQWHDVDFEKHILRIERQLLRPSGNGVQFSAPKTKHGRRSIPLSTQTIEVLREHQQHQVIIQQKVSNSRHDYGLIFTTKNGTPIHPRNLLKEFQSLLSLGGLPKLHFHSLRHSCASILLHNGIPIHAVSKMLGHSSPSITLNVYAHLLPSMEAEGSKMIDELIMPIQMQLKKPIVA
jgi:integrase